MRKVIQELTCDRCGKTKQVATGESAQVPGWRIVGTSEIYGPPNSMRSREICPPCMELFNDWFERSKL